MSGGAPNDLDVRRLELRAFGFNRGLEFFPEAIESRAPFLALDIGQLSETLELLGQPAALAERAHADFFERRDIGARTNGAERFLPARVEILRVAFSHGRDYAALADFAALSRAACACFAMLANAAG